MGGVALLMDRYLQTIYSGIVLIYINLKEQTEKEF